MADLVFPPRSLGVAPFFRRSFLLPGPASGDPSMTNRLSVSKLRFYTRLLLANSSAPHNSNSSSSTETSAPQSLHLLSKTELSDGSILFRFGDASERKRNLEEEEMSGRDGLKDDKAATGASVQSRDTGETMNHTPPPESYIEPGAERDESGSTLETTDSDRERFAQNGGSFVSANAAKTEAENKLLKPEKCRNLVKKDVQSKAVKTEQTRKVVKSDEPSHVVKTDEQSSVIKPNEHKLDEKQILHQITVSEDNGGIKEEQSDNSVLVQITAPSTANSPDKQRASATTESQTTWEPGIASGSFSSDLNSGIEISGAHESQRAAITESGVLVGDNKLDTVPCRGADTSADAGANKKSPVEGLAMSSNSEVKQVVVEKATSGEVDEPAGRLGAERTEAAPTLSTTEAIINANNESSEISAVSVDGDAVELLATGKHSKGDEIPRHDFFLDIGVTLLQHPSEALAGREDAYFVACQKWLGVADGVHQWSLEGVSRGWFAQELLRNCQKVVCDSEATPITDPVEVLSKSAAQTKSPGSSTFLVACFDNDALHVSNIGDSGFMVIRNGRVVSKSSPMVHDFIFPVQLKQGDDPSELVEVYNVELHESDVIIMATDGLFDNVYEKEVISVVSSSLQQNLNPQEIAELLAGRAQEIGQSSSVRTPFADGAKAAGYVGYRGGRLDAVTVVVSVVRKRS